ncbi:MAG: alpha-galactosidase, partial [Acidobacteriota bacterium]
MTEWRTTLKRCLWIVSLISLASSPAIASDHLGVSVDQDQLRFSLVTRNSATVLGVDQEGILVSLWEGDAPALVDQTADAVTGQLRQSGARQVAPVRGGFPQLASLLEIRFSDGVRGTRLRYVTHQVQEGGDSPELRITLEDSERNFQVVLGFRVHPELDLIERWAEVENRGDSVVTLEKLASASLVLDRGSYDLLHASGRWGQEFNIERTTLTGGSKVLEVRGQRFHHLSPWYMVRPSGESEEESGRVWFGSLAWSGNWRLEFEKTPEGDLQILGGINFWDSAWTLEPGGRFTSPVLITGTCAEGPGGASRRLHRYIRNHVLPEGARERVRPVLYNSWYATTFGVSDEQQVTLAKTAQ